MVEPNEKERGRTEVSESLPNPLHYWSQLQNTSRKCLVKLTYNVKTNIAKIIFELWVASRVSLLDMSNVTEWLSRSEEMAVFLLFTAWFYSMIASHIIIHSRRVL